MHIGIKAFKAKQAEGRYCCQKSRDQWKDIKKDVRDNIFIKSFGQEMQKKRAFHRQKGNPLPMPSHKITCQPNVYPKSILLGNLFMETLFIVYHRNAENYEQALPCFSSS